MGESHGTTLSIHADGKAGRNGPRPEPVLVLVLECGRPRAGSVRYRLSDLTVVALGRGSARRAEKAGTELTIRVPDKWMSSKHARIEPSFGRWMLVDTESKNGSIVDGHTTKRAVLTDGSLIELGHTLFIFFERMPISDDAPSLLELTPDEGIPGLVRSADGGTLFLDEIGDLPGTSQAALLRVLQEREVMPVGGTRAVAIDLRVVAATHRDLDDMVAEQSFRHDLFARLAGFRISVPPLAERRADLGVLIGSLHKSIFPPEHPGFEIDAARLLLRYPWPLNVRELEQALATAQVLAGNELVRAEHLPDTVRSGRPPGAPRPVVLSEMDQKVRDQVVAALREHQGNVSAVARALDKDRKQIQRWIKRFGLDPSTYR